MATSNTAIGRRIPRKMDPVIVEIILLAKKSKHWQRVAQILSNGRRRYSNLNLKDIDKMITDKTTVALIPGKVLGNGVLTKNVRVSALYFSASASDKLKKSKHEMISILDEIKKNPKAEGVSILA